MGMLVTSVRSCIMTTDAPWYHPSKFSVFNTEKLKIYGVEHIFHHSPESGCLGFIHPFSTYLEPHSKKIHTTWSKLINEHGWKCSNERVLYYNLQTVAGRCRNMTHKRRTCRAIFCVQLITLTLWFKFMLRVCRTGDSRLESRTTSEQIWDASNGANLHRAVDRIAWKSRRYRTKQFQIQSARSSAKIRLGTLFDWNVRQQRIDKIYVSQDGKSIVELISRQWELRTSVNNICVHQIL